MSSNADPFPLVFQIYIVREPSFINFCASYSKNTIRERYPLTSQLIEENSIPEFDNLYLDFNGIIHTCSHPNDEDAHFRMSEEQIYTSIFAYVDHLFGKIKPKKLFFMAVDGVAPRAKMNQQRSRRFRTAKEAREVRENAERKGEKLPEEKAFDSNCITPGTPFMVKLSEQLRYFVNKKISEDANWREVQVVLSGHEVPGEGEHKIMEYIRLSKAQPGYNPNVRHCLYGLDADLIMLGLLSHDPHFCLLREEVKFGPSARKKNNGGVESINFYLLHLSLLREYLDLEFRDVRRSLPFEYNLEHIIDDFIVLAVFVGNDFLPHLPDLHIHENGLERLFDVYMKVLPSLGGYLNESGNIDTKRLQVILDEMVEWEKEVFEKEYGDINWFKGKQSKHIKELERTENRGSLVLSPSQREIFEKVQKFVQQRQREVGANNNTARLELLNDFPARDREFVNKLAADLHLELAWDDYDEYDQNIVTFRLPESPGEAQADPEDEGEGDEEEWVSDEEEDEESRKAVDRVLGKYEKAKVVEYADKDFDQRYEEALKEKMDEWKRSYYMGKLEIEYDDPEQMASLVYRYVEGLQWVMHYYYSGVTSWSWFYDYHYAPRVSDFKGVAEMTFNFELGMPFRPFEQLMGVMPEASKELLPEAYRGLMWDPNSPIIDFYPQEFEQDLNGKKQEWEAVVKIPFIDEKRLLDAMKSREHLLTSEEMRRNTFGTSYQFEYNPGEPTVYPSSLPGFFPPLHHCTCTMEPFDLPTLDGLHLVKGLCDGVFLGTSALAGFPSLKTLPHTSSLGFHGVNVHGSESRNKSIVIHIENPHAPRKPEDIAQDLIGRRTFSGWPFLQEAMVVGVSDALFKYEKMTVVPGAPSKVVQNPHSKLGLTMWKNKAERIESVYSKKCGVLTGGVDILLHVRPLKGLKRLESGALVKDYEGPDKEYELGLQLAVAEVESEDPRYIERGPSSLNEEFPEGGKVFFLGEHAYGFAARVAATAADSLSFVLAFSPSEKLENEALKEVVAKSMATQYIPSFQVAEMLAMSKRALSRVTSSFMVLINDGQKVNLGLSIKFEGKAMKVLSYSNKSGHVWEFSDLAIDLIRDYKEKYPEVFRILDRGGDDMAKASTIFPSEDDPGAKAKEIRTWLVTKGVRDFEPVSLLCDQLEKNIVKEIEQLADGFNKERSASDFKRAMVKNVPRRAVLKPEHAVYRLQNQKFDLGDRVVMVQESGGVPLSAKGVVIGVNTKTIDVVWDVPFISGTTLNNRCSQYRGSSVEFNACLNLTNRQFVSAVNPPAPPSPQQQQQQQEAKLQPRSRFGSHSSWGPGGQRAPSGAWRAPSHPGFSRSSGPSSTSVHIMTNPNRGRGGVHLNGHGPAPGGSQPNGPTRHAHSTSTDDQDSPRGWGSGYQQEYRRPPGPPRGGFIGLTRGRGGFNRGFRGGFRGRGGYSATPPLSS
ncbi:exonuclease II [Multifurca ochricompacta]|uniref:5'-3' exoribonuclease 1 n=1 Tax=Multifurca ochricompacta TaxID=376703 RepID=A0AAD4QPW9_9AGAM|nr:exonuclease II [Multifurca ochricompacta]